MENKFDYKKREQEIYKNWEESGSFKCKKDESKKTYKKRIERVYLNKWGIPELR